jgi:hypothetical protein
MTTEVLLGKPGSLPNIPIQEIAIVISEGVGRTGCHIGENRGLVNHYSRPVHVIGRSPPKNPRCLVTFGQVESHILFTKSDEGEMILNDLVDEFIVKFTPPL